MITLDTMERLHVVDIRQEEELEVLDVGDVKLVYGSSHFKSLATGGNVSPAMVCTFIFVYINLTVER